MTIIFAVVTGLLLLLLPLIIDRGGLTAVVHPTFGAALVLLGHAEIDLFLGDSFWPYYALSIALFVAGYYMTSSRYAGHPPALSPLPATAGGGRASYELVVLRRVATVVSLFVAYHFVVGGIPIFSENVETERFAFGDSGLFGIPGRMFLFGLPFIVTYASYVADRDPRPEAKRILAYLWTEYVVSMIISGFKGSLVSVVLLWVVIRSMLGRPILIRDVIRPRYLAIGLGSILFGALVAQQYKTVDINEGGGVGAYLLERITVVAAAPGAFAIRYLDHKTDGYYNVDDFSYFLEKYFHLNVSKEPVQPLDKTVSSALTHTPLEDDEFIVPVTVGGFPALVVDIGIPLALAMILIAGTAFGFFRQRAEGAHSAFEFGVCGIALHSIESFVVNGGLAYCTINAIAMVAMLGVIHFLCSMAIPGHGLERST